MSRFLSFVIFVGFLSLACGSTNSDLAVSTTRPSATVTTSSVADSSPTTTVSVGATIATTTTAVAENWFGPRHPLTGLPAPDGPLQHPALAVKVGNNDINSLPHEGLEGADVVYEALIENGKTRFVAIYQSNVPSRVGPIRSARSTDIDLIGNLNLPFFCLLGKQ